MMGIRKRICLEVRKTLDIKVNTLFTTYYNHDSTGDERCWGSNLASPHSLTH
jgi:hypothetical protein